MKCSKLFHEHYKNYEYYEGIGRILLMCLAGAFWLSAVCVLAYNGWYIIKCATIPELIIYDFINSLLR